MPCPRAQAQFDGSLRVIVEQLDETHQPSPEELAARLGARATEYGLVRHDGPRSELYQPAGDAPLRQRKPPVPARGAGHEQRRAPSQTRRAGRGCGPQLQRPGAHRLHGPQPHRAELSTRDLQEAQRRAHRARPRDPDTGGSGGLPDRAVHPRRERDTGVPRAPPDGESAGSSRARLHPGLGQGRGSLRHRDRARGRGQLDAAEPRRARRPRRGQEERRDGALPAPGHHPVRADDGAVRPGGHRPLPGDLPGRDLPAVELPWRLRGRPDRADVLAAAWREDPHQHHQLQELHHHLR